MSHKHTLESAQDLILAASPGTSWVIQQYQGALSKDSVFYNTATGQTITYRLHDFVKKLRVNPNYEFYGGIETVAQLKDRLDALAQDRWSVLGRDDNKFTILDTKNGKESTGSANDLLSKARAKLRKEGKGPPTKATPKQVKVAKKNGEVRKAKSEAKAKEWLAEHAPTVEIVEWGGGMSMRSTFSKDGKEFPYSFNDVRKMIQKGKLVTLGEGKASALAMAGRDNKSSEEAVKQWLVENTPEITLVEYGGSIGDKSKFVRNGVEFECTMHSIKGRARNGNNNIGLGKPVTTQSEAEEWLSANMPEVTILEWGGKGSAISKFSSPYGEFEYAFTNMRVNKEINGYDKIGIGTGQNRQSMGREEAESWLVENYPEVTITEWGGNASSKSEFRYEDISVSRSFTSTFATLKCEWSNGRRPGSHGWLSHGQAQQQIDDLVGPNIYELVKYIPATYGMCVYKKVSTGEEFEYFHNSLLGSLRVNKNCTFRNGKSSLESTIEDFLTENGIDFIANKAMYINGRKVLPDIQIPDYNLIIECDGLYWHSDAYKDNKYHMQKSKAYKEVGYRALFFRENEIYNQLDIVTSIISNQLGLISDSIGARKCSIVQGDYVDFLQDNHLMGKGAGKMYALEYNGKPVAVMQVKWKTKASKEMEVSRFCLAKNTRVPGAFSRLLKHAITEYSPNQVLTFIDLRYGSGAYLSDLGFEMVSLHPSFKWTRGVETVGRMTYPGDLGYENGYRKIWDCGQAKWVKNCLR